MEERVNEVMGGEKGRKVHLVG